jgi:hypothetical protein
MVLLLRALGLKRSIAIAGGLLYGLFPAHDASFTLRAVHMHWSSAFLAIALWLLVLQARSQRIWLLAAGMVVAESLSLLFYEASYGLVAIAPLLLFAGRGLTTRRRVALAAIWYVPPLLNGIRILQLMNSGKPLYQEGVISHTGRPLSLFIDLAKYVWRGALSPIDGPHGHAIAVLPVVAFAALVALAIINRRDSGDSGDHQWRYAAIGVGSLVLAPATALVYLANTGFFVDPIRVFSVVALPLTIGICTAVAAAGLYWRHAEAVAAIVLIPLVLTAAQADRKYWHQRSDEDRQVLGAILVATSRAPATDHVLVVDADHLLGRDLYALQGQILVTALLYLRDRPRDSIVHCGALGTPAVAGVSSGCSRTTAGFIIDGKSPVAYPVVVDLHRRTSTAPVLADMANVTRRERELLPCIAKNRCQQGPYGVDATLVPG